MRLTERVREFIPKVGAACCKEWGTHEDERTVLYKTKTDDIVQTTQSTHTCANCM